MNKFVPAAVAGTVLTAAAVGAFTLGDDTSQSTLAQGDLGEYASCEVWHSVENVGDSLFCLYSPTTTLPPTTTTIAPTTTTVAPTTTTVAPTTTTTVAPTTTTVAPTTTTRPPTTTTTVAPTTTTRPPTTTTTVPPTTTTQPPSGGPPVLVGAAVDRQTGQTSAQAITAFNNQIGATIDIVRAFSPDFPASFTSVQSFAATQNYDRVLSVKGNPTQANWVTFFNTLPTNGTQTYITINHEPENDGGSMTPAVLKQRHATMRAAWVQLGRPAHIHLMAIFMSWHENDNDPNTSTALWFPDNIQDFTLGLDPYDPNGVRQMEDIVAATVALWTNSGGRDWMITEVGTKRTGTAGAQWIINAFDYCQETWSATSRCLSIQWFHSAVGANGPWWLPTGIMSTTWGDEVDAPR